MLCLLRFAGSKYLMRVCRGVIFPKRSSNSSTCAERDNGMHLALFADVSTCNAVSWLPYGSSGLWVQRTPTLSSHRRQARAIFSPDACFALARNARGMEHTRVIIQHNRTRLEVVNAHEGQNAHNTAHTHLTKRRHNMFTGQRNTQHDRINVPPSTE